MKNKIELITYMGSDELHSLAAWSSTFAEFDIDLPVNIENRVDIIVNHILNNGKKKRSIEELLQYLAANSHTSPFRFSSFVFAMTTDIATHIQKLKHSVILEAENGESARYKELQENKYYLPEDWLGNEISIKYYNKLEEISKLTNAIYHDCLGDLTPIIGKQRAKETARYFKTYNSQINTLNKFSFDGIMQFYNKRHTEHAQLEIADIAKQMLDCIKSIEGNPFKYSLKAFSY